MRLEKVEKSLERRVGGVMNVVTSAVTRWRFRGAGSGILLKRDIAFPHQQPDGGVTRGVAIAPVALAGAIMPGVARFIIMLSAHADVFGVGTTVVIGSMLVAASSVTAG